MQITPTALNRSHCERARRARDARFDGRFFTAVKSTGIYCRPICPANPPLEKNVEYYASAIAAAQNGYRPCLRCRPDSAPKSSAWMGTQTTFQRALNLIQQGALQFSSISELATRVGISDRYLRDLFQENLGISPKKYAIYQQCLFAKQLLHESTLPITEIAFASGFNSVRRFNEAMQEQIGLTPRDIRKSDKAPVNKLSLKMYFRPPYAWQHLYEFLKTRAIDGLECTQEGSYSRSIEYMGTQGLLTVSPRLDKNYLLVSLQLNDYRHLNPIMQRVKEMFDVDAPISEIDQQLQTVIGKPFDYKSGLRVPGIFSTFEAGVRAILGQQVSVAAALKLVHQLVENLGEPLALELSAVSTLFPTPEAVASNSLDFFRMPQSRKDTLHRLAEHFISAENPHDVDQWLAIKGIGPWTVAYVKMRATKDPDVWLTGDAGIKNALKLLNRELDVCAVQPWRSYLSMHLWNQL